MKSFRHAGFSVMQGCTLFRLLGLKCLRSVLWAEKMRNIPYAYSYSREAFELEGTDNSCLDSSTLRRKTAFWTIPHRAKFYGALKYAHVTRLHSLPGKLIARLGALPRR
jgi:hypothetical protein